MQTIKGNTKRAQELRSRALHYEGYDLYDVYGRVSRAKDTAYDECYEMYRAENGEDFRICGHCTTNFTVAWRVENGWRMETYRNSYLILDDETEED